jgi:hypothetical protein
MPRGKHISHDCRGVCTKGAMGEVHTHMHTWAFVNGSTTRLHLPPAKCLYTLRPPVGCRNASG